MGDLWRAIVETIQYLWPFTIVMEYEKGCFYILGRMWKVVDAGLYFAPPFLTEIKKFSVQPAPVLAPRQDITLRDGSWLHYSVSGLCHVQDIDLAVNRIDNYSESTQELLMRVSANFLSSMEFERAQPERRGKLLNSLSQKVAEEAAVYGITASDVSFTNFVRGPRMYRLLTGEVGMGSTW